MNVFFVIVQAMCENYMLYFKLLYGTTQKLFFRQTSNQTGHHKEWNIKMWFCKQCSSCFNFRLFGKIRRIRAFSFLLWESFTTENFQTSNFFFKKNNSTVASDLLQTFILNSYCTIWFLFGENISPKNTLKTICYRIWKRPQCSSHAGRRTQGLVSIVNLQGTLSKINHKK